jgi:hypothetical protein
MSEGSMEVELDVREEGESLRVTEVVSVDADLLA